MRYDTLKGPLKTGWLFFSVKVMQGVKLGATCTCTVNVQCSDNGHYLVEEQTLHNSTNIYHKQN